MLSVWMASWTDLAFTGAGRLLSWLDFRERERCVSNLLGGGVEGSRLTRAGARAWTLLLRRGGSGPAAARVESMMGRRGMKGRRK